ncbi:unnamed protein product [Timema podura]|uniref:Uncharacterized protein n=1 Tax=Timema podura TaxID=61482 RepID=A0ABN7NCM4_TIMPD|nr:unnamed protein product [Timema podura]
MSTDTLFIKRYDCIDRKRFNVLQYQRGHIEFWPRNSWVIWKVCAIANHNMAIRNTKNLTASPKLSASFGSFVSMVTLRKTQKIHSRVCFLSKLCNHRTKKHAFVIWASVQEAAHSVDVDVTVNQEVLDMGRVVETNGRNVYPTLLATLSKILNILKKTKQKGKKTCVARFTLDYFLMSSDNEAHVGAWAVMIDFLQEVAIISLSSRSDI